MSQGEPFRWVPIHASERLATFGLREPSDRAHADDDGDSWDGAAEAVPSGGACGACEAWGEAAPAPASAGALGGGSGGRKGSSSAKVVPVAGEG